MVKDNHNSTSSRERFDDSIEFNFIDFVQFAYSRRGFVVWFSVLFSAALLTYVIMIQKSVYRSQATVNLNFSSKSNSFLSRGFANWIEEQELENKVYLTEQFFESSGFRKALHKEVVGETNLCQTEECVSYKTVLKDYLQRSRMIDADSQVAALFDMLEIFPDSQKYILTITGKSKDPRVSHAITNLATHTLVDLNYEFLLQKNSRVRKFLEDQTSSTSEELKKLEKVLVSKQQQFDLILTPDTEGKLTNIGIDQQQKILELDREKTGLDLLESEVATSIRDLKNELASANSPSFIYLSQAQKRLDLIKYQMSLNHNDKTRTVAAATTKSPEELEADAYRDILQNSRADMTATDPWEYLKKYEGFLLEVRQKRERVVSELSAAKTAFNGWAAKFTTMPEVFRELTELRRNIEITTELYSQLKTRLQEINIQEAERANDLSILALPDVPTHPVGMPLSKKVALVALAGPGVSVILLLMNFVLVPLVRSAKDIEWMGVRVLGSLTTYRKGSKLIPGEQRPVVLTEAPEGYHANGIRYIRLRLEQELARIRGDKSGKLLTVTSFNSGEGKTFSTVNLGTAFAASFLPTVLVDLDFKRTDMSLYFDEPFEETSIQSEDERVELTLRVYSPYLHALRIKFHGVDARDYVRSASFGDILEKLRKEYRFVLIDTAPIDGNVEAYLVASQTDAVMFVINQRTTLRDDVVQGIERLQETSSAPVYALLNFSNEGIKLSTRKNRTAV